MGKWLWRKEVRRIWGGSTCEGTVTLACISLEEEEEVTRRRHKREVRAILSR